jgi:hypothetical protein
MIECSDQMKTLRSFVSFIAFVIPLLSAGHPSHAGDKSYCSAMIPCPVLNTPDFRAVFGGSDGKTVRTDKKGLVRALEFIALPGTSFEVLSEIKKGSHSILEVKTRDYPSDGPLYIDSRFAAFFEEKAPERKKILLSKEEILSSMLSMERQPYMWGGNYAGGIDRMPEFYPPSGVVSSKTLSLWRLEGVDCSGLIYQASGGYTPRNTSSMLGFGEGLSISGLSAEQISEKLRPLDLIVWPGHVVVVLNPHYVIESTHPEGVIISKLLPRLRSIMSERTPGNGQGLFPEKYFLIKRWHNEN